MHSATVGLYPGLMNDRGSHGSAGYGAAVPDVPARSISPSPTRSTRGCTRTRRSTRPSPRRSGPRLRQTYHRARATTVRTIEPVPGLPDMVFAANGATVVDGTVLGARFRYPQRAAEARRVPALVPRARAIRGSGPPGTSTRARATSCSPAGRCSPAPASAPTRPPRRSRGAVRPAGDQPAAGRPALLPPGHRAVRARRRTPPCTTRPRSTTPGGRRSAAQFPELIEAKDEDAEVLGLNAVSDGRHVVLPAQATGPGRAAARARVRAGRGGHVRAAQGRRRPEVLHAGGAGLREPS